MGVASTSISAIYNNILYCFDRKYVLTETEDSMIIHSRKKSLN